MNYDHLGKCLDLTMDAHRGGEGLKLALAPTPLENLFFFYI